MRKFWLYYTGDGKGVRNDFWEIEKVKLALEANATGTRNDFYKQITIKKEGNWQSQINNREIIEETKIVLLIRSAKV